MINFTEYILEAITLTSQYHSELNPNLWDDSTLKLEVKEHLLKISLAWAKFANIKEKSIIDIILVGGNANYNYTKYSDIDVHLILDKNEYGDEIEVFNDYFKDKQKIWNVLHNIKMYDHSVELYALLEGSSSPTDQGVYSILKNKWIQKPKHEKLLPDSIDIQRKVEEYAHNIDHNISSNSSIEHILGIKKKLKNMRQAGLKHAGEFSIENIVFKELRNLGYLEKINNYVNRKEDKELSLT